MFLLSNLLICFLLKTHAYALDSNSSFCYVSAQDRTHFYKHVSTQIDNESYMIFTNFNSFDEMRLNCSSSKYPIREMSKAKQALNIEFIPKSKNLIIDEAFTRFIYDSFNKSDLLSYDDTCIVLNNIKGIENNLFRMNYKLNSASLVIAFSKFDLYHFGAQIDEDTCHLIKGVNTFFAHFDELLFSKVKYPAFLCANLLYDSNVRKLTLKCLTL